MRYGVLLLGTHLGEGAVEAVGDKQRIVPEAAAAGRAFGYASLDDTLEEVLLAALDERYDRAETRTAVVAARKLRQQTSVVGLEVVAVGGITRRMNARRTAQSLDLQARVVGEAVAAGAVVYVVRLLRGVALQRGLLLGYIFGYAALARCGEAESVAQHGLDLRELVGVVGCKNKFHRLSSVLSDPTTAGLLNSLPRRRIRLP